MLVLYEIEGITMREVAEVVGCPLQTAYSRLQSGRASLRSAWLRASTSP
ncbi:MAG TPA: sigma factor-like helix-turn-helix DNA-binding protein [Polyangiaceae bacterium]|nr:sigma factor-like helix-turn-helix DNA-binding protein [Polyangiaceae bacterium]